MRQPPPHAALPPDLKRTPAEKSAAALRGQASAARSERVVGELARRRGHVLLAKRLLPLVALTLLAAVIAWPQLHRDISVAHLGATPAAEPASGEMSNGRYNGVNENGEPFTVTADSAHQVAQDRIDLRAPVGDISLRGGTWMQGKGQRGVFDQQSGLLDLAGDVTLYRDDGTTLVTDTATIDTRQSAATTADKVHAEGPFGTLDAQGFAVLDHGAVIQFTGPARMVLQGAGK